MEAIESVELQVRSKNSQLRDNTLNMHGIRNSRMKW